MGLCDTLASMTFADDVALLYRSIQQIHDVLMDLSLEYNSVRRGVIIGYFFSFFFKDYIKHQEASD